MQVTKGTWRMQEHCVPGSVSSSTTQEPGNEAITDSAIILSILNQSVHAEEQKGSGLQDYSMVVK